MNIVGKIIVLRAVEEEDLEILREAINDPWLESLVSGWSFPISKVHQKLWFEKIEQNKNTIPLIIETKEAGVVGLTGIRNIDWKNRTADGGVKIFRKELTSRGIGLDTYMTFLRYCFDELQLNRINGSILSYNEASKKLLLHKVGYTQEGVMRQCIFKNGQYHDLIMIGILREDYYRRAKDLKYWEK